jgi:hypothetical protein
MAVPKMEAQEAEQQVQTVQTVVVVRQLEVVVHQQVARAELMVVIPRVLQEP